MNKLSIKDLEVKGQKVFLRVDFNVPLDSEQNVTDATRIKAALPTIQYLLDNGARLILVSHLGRPKGKSVDTLSLRPVATALEALLGRPVRFSSQVLGDVAKTAIDTLENGDCILLENIRFFPEEEKNDAQFAKELASLADKYVNDAFGTAHRAHASTEGVARYFDDAACGFLIQKELKFLGSAVETPKAPFCAILGGAKVSDKIPVITRLLDKADDILIGGGMAYTFLHVQGHTIGASMLDSDSIEIAKEILAKAKKLGKNIHLPVDHHVAETFSNDAKDQFTGIDIPDGFMALDIGPKTIEAYQKVINNAQTVIWNGPMGVFEFENYQAGSFSIAEAMAVNEGTTIVGGGDSVAAVNLINKGAEMDHVSTGGGASLEFLEGKILPGIEALATK